MRILTSIFLSALFFSAAAQSVSVIQEQAQYYSQFTPRSDAAWDSVRISEGAPAVSAVSRSPQLCTLNKRVFGWHPYWVGTVYNNYQWNLLSDLCYFDYAVSPTTGNNTNGSFAWSTSAAVTAALNNGVDVHICATLFGGHSTFWASSTAQQTFITNIISLLQARGGKGVNIDFEGMGSSDRIPFTNFMINLSNQLHTAIPGSELSMALYAVDWSNTFDIAALTPYVDLFVIMGYDYYWSGSTTAGPGDPLYNFQTTYNYTLHRSMTFYLNQGMPESKLLLGLPYYGREWETSSGTVPSATTGNYSATKTYAVVRNNASGYYSSQQWEPVSFSNYYTYQYLGNWRQCFINSAYALGQRFDAVNYRGIGGIGIWALGYDDGYSDYWNEIETHFTDCATVPCSDTLYDTGGPSRSYYNNEDFTYTIAPAGAFSVQLSFSAFVTEANYDTLWIYDGPNTASPLIGFYHGSNAPGTVTSTGPTMTLRFKSDVSTVNSGWSAIWQCLSDAIAPHTAVTVPPGWVTQDFQASFHDTDNVNGSGVSEGFYLVSVFDQASNGWSANAATGFLHDTQLNSLTWTPVSGNWTNVNNYLEQTDESNGNTNYYTSLQQNGAQAYLYEWEAVIGGSGSNRRAGLHYFSDNGSLTNRGNSYFVWFRLDQQTLEFYKTINDVFYLQHSVPVSLAANTAYRFRVIYNPMTGRTDVYKDLAYVGSWTDTAPYTSGSYISLRSGNSYYRVDHVKVYKGRPVNGNTLVTVGTPLSDIFHEDDHSLPNDAAMILSLALDSARNFSNYTVNWPQVQVDWTPPVQWYYVNDGSGPDISITTNLTQLEANWCCPADTNSDVAEYFYCFGTTPGDSDVVAWTSNGTSLSVTRTGLTLTPGQTYYCCVRAVNYAGLRSSLCSDGQLADLGLGLGDDQPLEAVRVFPNPFVSDFAVRLVLAGQARLRFSLTDLQGRLVRDLGEKQLPEGVTELAFNGDGLAPGYYLLKVGTGGRDIFVNLAHQ